MTSDFHCACGERNPENYYTWVRHGRPVYHKSECKKCRNTRVQEKRRDDVTVRIKERNRQLQRNYGITADDFEEQLKKQSYCCAICGGWWEDDNQYGMHSDHNHNTKEFRGVLCHNCNIMLGHAKDDVRVLRKAIEYL